MSAKKRKRRRAMLLSMHVALDEKVSNQINLEDFKEETRKRRKMDTTKNGDSILSSVDGSIIIELEQMAKKYFGNDENENDLSGTDIKGMNDLHALLSEMMEHPYYKIDNGTE